MLRRIGLLVCRMYGDDVPNYTPVERWSIKASKLTTPDEIIGAAVIQSFAKDFKDWKLVGSLTDRTKKYTQASPGSYTTIENKKKKIVVKIGLYEYSKDGDGLSPWKNAPLECLINDVPVSSAVGEEIRKRYMMLAEQAKRVQETADRAKADMERNEAAWNLAEKLLGMKRNEFGALVPVTVEEIKTPRRVKPTTKSDLIEIEEKCKHGNKACTDIWCDRDCHCK